MSLLHQKLAEVRWRLARACHALAAELEDAKVKEALIREGYKHAEAALAADDNSSLKSQSDPAESTNKTANPPNKTANPPQEQAIFVQEGRKKTISKRF